MNARCGNIRAVAGGCLLCLSMVAGCLREPVQTPYQQLEAAGEQVVEQLVKARRALGDGNYTRALGMLDSLLLNIPDLPEAHYLRGEILLQLYKLDEADAAFKETVTHDPYHRGGWYKRGHVAIEKGQYHQAISMYRRQQEAVLSSPDELRTYYEDEDASVLTLTWMQIGRSYELLQVADSARWAYEEALALDSTQAQANAWLANLYDEEGQTDEALHYMRRALHYDSGNPDFAYQLGTLLFENGNLEESLPLLEHVIAVQPWNPGAHYNLGRALIALGREEEGRPYLALTEKLQNLDQEIDLARAAAASYPNDPARWQKLANLLGYAGRREEQRQALAVARAVAQHADAQIRADTQ